MHARDPHVARGGCVIPLSRHSCAAALTVSPPHGAACPASTPRCGVPVPVWDPTPGSSRMAGGARVLRGICLKLSHGAATTSSSSSLMLVEMWGAGGAPLQRSSAVHPALAPRAWASPQSSAAELPSRAVPAAALLRPRLSLLSPMAPSCSNPPPPAVCEHVAVVPAGRGTRGSIPRLRGTKAASEVLGSKVGIWARRIPPDPPRASRAPSPLWGRRFLRLRAAPRAHVAMGLDGATSGGCSAPLSPSMGSNVGLLASPEVPQGAPCPHLRAPGALPPHWPRGRGAASSALSMCRCVEVAVVGVRVWCCVPDGV